MNEETEAALMRAGHQIEALQAEVYRLKREVLRLSVDGIHTCGPECPRIACVQRRENAELKAKLQRQALDYLSLDTQCDEILRGVVALKAERDALKADAERYRYLRNRNPHDVLFRTGPAAGCWIDCESETNDLALLTGGDADAAIDAAKEKKE